MPMIGIMISTLESPGVDLTYLKPSINCPFFAATLGAGSSSSALIRQSMKTTTP